LLIQGVVQACDLFQPQQKRHQRAHLVDDPLDSLAFVILRHCQLLNREEGLFLPHDRKEGMRAFPAKGRCPRDHCASYRVIDCATLFDRLS